MNFNIGKLYEIKQYFWLFYPTEEKAAAAAGSTAGASRRPLGLGVAHPTFAIGATVAAEYWSKQLNCIVSYIPEHSLITVLKQDKEYANVLTSNGLLGWIYVPTQDWVKDCFEEVIS